MKTTIAILIALLCAFANAQITKDNIKQLLIAQGFDNPDGAAEELYQQYNENNLIDNNSILSRGLAESALSGLSMGFYQSRNAWDSKNISWIPKFMQNWYLNKPGVDNLLGQFFTWQKIFRETDYMSDRLAYEDLYEYFNGNWWLATLTDVFVKNLFGAMIRRKMN